MKKQIFLIMLAVILMAALTGCGEKNSATSTQSLKGEQGELDASAEKLSESQLKIICKGENEAIVTLTDDNISSIIENQSNIIQLCLLSGDNDLCYIRDKIASWYAYSGECDTTTDEPLWFYDGENRQSIEGNTITWKLMQSGIAETLKQCDTYEVTFEFHGSVEDKVIVEGSVDVEEGDFATSEGLEMLEVSDDLLIIRVKNKDAINSKDQSGTIFNIDFFSSEEDRETAHFNLTLTISDYNTVYAQSVEYDDNNCYIYHDITNDIGNREIGRTINTDYGMAIQCTNSTVISMIRNQLMYDINENDNQSLYAMGYIADSKISIPAIPEEFASTDPVDFTPITDNYKIIEVIIPECEFVTPVWYQRMGMWVYGPNGQIFNEDIKIVYLLSLDAFDEVVDAKMKIIYASEDALIADIFMNFTEYIVAVDITGVNEPDDSIITPEFIEQYDMEVFGSAESSGFSLEYLGDYTNTRYYNFDYTLDSHDLPTVVNWGFHSIMSYSDMQYSSNEILSDTWNGYPIRTYSTVKDYSTFIEEKGQYNTAPEDWHDHPYATFLPELPQGVTVNYAPYNDGQLELYTDDGGCTREQAMEFIGKLREVDYTEIRYDIESKEEIQYVFVIGDGIIITAKWSKDRQYLWIHGFSE